jgi:hypothetical protein
MNNYIKIVDYKVFWKVVHFNIENNVRIEIRNIVSRTVHIIVLNIVSNNVWGTVAWNVKNNVSNRVIYNHKLFKYNDLKQYKDNL